MVSIDNLNSVTIPLKISKYNGQQYCTFCSKKSGNCFLIRTNKGSKIVCFNCKIQINKNFNLKFERETFSNNRNIFSGGLPFTNRRKF